MGDGERDTTTREGPRRAVSDAQADGRRPRAVSRRLVIGVAAGAVAGVAVGAGVLGSRSGAPGEPVPAGIPAPTGVPSSRGTGLAVDTRGRIRVDLVAPGVVRIRIGAPDAAEPHSYAVEQPLIAQDAAVESAGATATLVAGDLRVVVDSSTGALSASRAGREFLREADPGWQRLAAGYRWRLRLPAGESCLQVGRSHLH